MKKYIRTIFIILIFSAGLIYIVIQILIPFFALQVVDGSTREEIPIYGGYYYDTVFEHIAKRSNATIKIIFESSVDSMTYDSNLIIIYSLIKS